MSNIDYRGRYERTELVKTKQKLHYAKLRVSKFEDELQKAVKEVEELQHRQEQLQKDAA